MTIKRSLPWFFTLFLLLVLLSAKTQPAGYYDAASGLSGNALKTALHNIIDNHTTIAYDWLMKP